MGLARNTSDVLNTLTVKREANNMSFILPAERRYGMLFHVLGPALRKFSKQISRHAGRQEHGIGPVAGTLYRVALKHGQPNRPKGRWAMHTHATPLATNRLCRGDYCTNHTVDGFSSCTLQTMQSYEMCW